MCGSVRCAKAELELVGRDDVRARDDAVADQVLHLGRDEAAGLGAAEDGVAGVHGLRVALLDERDGVEDRVADVVAALVAAEDEVDVGQPAAVVDPFHDAADDLAGGISCPPHAPYPVWLENTTV